jgi:hypothetical protein
LGRFITYALRRPRTTTDQFEEGYGLAQAISYRLAAIVYDGIERHDGLIAAAATLAIAVFTFTLWRSTDKLWTASKAASERQEQDTRILQRAYISVEPCGVSQWLSDHRTPEAQFIGHIGIRNVGNLPAREISWSIHMKWSESGEISDFPITEPRYGGHNVLPPGSIMRHGGPMKPWRPAGYFYVWGDVIYGDGFGHQRTTQFCHRYNCRRFARGGIAPEYGRHHHYGNDAD